ncbi:hypothetical protein GIV66_31325 [Pseudomonas sp. PA-3-11C]|uniref:hypothetical protein n=1 Tax=unclassified Pseudomonas TaxID=196821 RepID=UPI001F26F1D2|nr:MULTISPECIES: hypothetical protein [unclassified Pseudomonas]MCF5509717.1 hypothetical protein [Pseudomonas sp. PA-3-6H]MCF5565104.1 hypothetical protein [Pseudomonas sp. PA-3-5D]MCF5571254.1 hypothetical protein [Pseudomonas sp. PA-3-11C]MCF5597121.1 hypothetical protein [Pseudomonas sp. PA-3-10C]
MKNGIGVITGDLYKSSVGYERGLPYLKSMETVLKNLESLDMFSIQKIDIFRGDFFQITLSDPAYFLDLAVYLRSCLISLSDDIEKKYDARLSLSYSEMDLFTELRDRSYFEEAYLLSGRGLDDMPKNMMMAFNSSIEGWHRSFNGPIRLLDFIIGSLSKPQAQVLSEIILERKINVLGLSARTGKTQQNIYKLMDRGGIRQIYDFLEYSRDQIHFLRR